MVEIVEASYLDPTSLTLKIRSNMVNVGTLVSVTQMMALISDIKGITVIKKAVISKHIEHLGEATHTIMDIDKLKEVEPECVLMIDSTYEVDMPSSMMQRKREVSVDRSITRGN